MNTSNIGSIVGHGLASMVVLGVPLLLLGLPNDWQAMTVAALLGGLLKWAHLYLNNTLS